MEATLQVAPGELQQLLRDFSSFSGVVQEQAEKRALFKSAGEFAKRLRRKIPKSRARGVLSIPSNSREYRRLRKLGREPPRRKKRHLKTSVAVRPGRYGRRSLKGINPHLGAGIAVGYRGVARYYGHLLERGTSRYAGQRQWETTSRDIPSIVHGELIAMMADVPKYLTRGRRRGGRR